jgi:Amt family ammonium transporter
MDGSVIVKGLLYGGGTQQLLAQAIGSAAVCLTTFSVAMVLMYAVKATGTLRVSAEGELEGLDLHEHGMPAYPEYVIHGDTPHFATSSTPSSQPVPAAVPQPARQ